MPLETGARLGTYEIVEPIGAGAMGEIYRAKDLKLGREVAVKVLPESLATDRERLRRFKQEAQAASALNHPNIVHIYDVGQEVDTHYIVMELVSGASLRKVLADEAPLTPERALDYARQMTAGLQNAHAAGIVHRDIKPENIMVTTEGYVKILDFGLAKLLELPFETHSEMATVAREGTRHGMLIGTVEYMSPEQASGKEVDHRSDQFSIGLIIYEMVTGQLAFRRETAAQTLASIIESPPRPVAEINRDCPSDLVGVIERCLSKSTSDRYRDTRDLLSELSSVSLTPPLPPLPPVPQSPEPDLPPMVEGVRHVPGVLRGSSGARDFEIQKDSGRIVSISEGRLRRKLRKHRFSGDELMRREGDATWTPLYESEVFRQEVAFTGDPGDFVRRKKWRDFMQHASTFFIFGTVWWVWRGEVPFWMGFWGMGLVGHAVSILPGAWPFQKKLPDAPEDVIDVVPETSEALPEPDLPEPFGDEVSRVKELLDRRGGEHAAVLVAEVDKIASRVKELVRKDRDLEEQTSPSERTRLRETIEGAEQKLSVVDSAGDKKLFQRQLDVLHSRESAIEKALVVLDRLRARRDVAFNQIKQLRLDLSRAEASSASVPELTSRLQDIRHEVDATEQVDEAIAQELLS